MTLIPTPSIKSPNTIVALDDIAIAAGASEYSKIISIAGFRHKQIVIAAKDLSAGKEVDFDFMVSNQHDVDFEAAASSDNIWSLCQVKNLTTQTTSNGTINIADADDEQMLALNVDGCRYLVIKATFTGTGQTARTVVDLFGKHNEDN